MNDKRRKRRAVRIGILVVVGMLVLLPGLGVLYLKFADLSRYSARVERLVSDAIGRELRIEGEFEPEIGWTTTLRAGKVSLANPDWSAEPTMVYVERLEAEVDLGSILSGPIRLHDIRIEGARIRVEFAEDGRDNWTFDVASNDEEETDEPDTLGVSFDRIELRDVEVVIDDDAWERPWVVQVDRIDAHLVDPETLDVNLDAHLAERPLELAGRISSVDRLILAGPVEHDLTGRFGEDRVAFRGSLTDLASLEGPDLALEMNGPDIGALTEPLGLPSLGHGPYRLNVRTAPAGANLDVALEVQADRFEVEAHGRVDSLVEPREFDLTIAAAGENLQAVGDLAGIVGLPEKPFSASGQLIHDETTTSFRKVEAVLGDVAISIDGTLGSLPDLLGTELRFEMSGPDLSVARRLVRLELPAKPFESSGHLSHQPQGLVLENVRARIGATEFTASGTVGPAPEYAGTDLVVSVDGPDLSVFEGLAGVELPAKPFRVDAHGVHAPTGIALDSTTARLGEQTLRLDGSVALGPGWVGSDLRVHFEGPDLAELGRLADLRDFPAKPFDAGGRIRVLADGFELEGAEARIGEIDLAADGHVGPLSDPTGTELRFSVEMERLDTLGDYIKDAPPLPAEPLSVAGGFGIESDGYVLQQIAGTLGSVEFRADGRLGPLPEVTGSEIEFGISGPDLSDVERMLASIELVEALGTPATTFDLSGSVRVTAAGYEIDDLLARVDSDEVRVRGTVGPQPQFSGTDLVIEGSGADGSWIGDLALLPLPAEPYRVQGRVQRLESGYRFENLEAEFGDYRVEVEGVLGEPPRLEGTNLDVSAEGPDLTPIRRFADLPVWLDGRFSVSGHADGTPEEFSVERLRVKLGDSDLAGSLRIDLRGKPFIYADLTSDQLDLAGLLGASFGEANVEIAEPTAADPPAEPSTHASNSKKNRLLISDEAFDADALGYLNLDLDLSATRVASRGSRLRDLKIGVDLLDGKLSVNPFEVTGEKGAVLDGSLVFAPVPEGYALRTRLRMENARADFMSYGNDPALWPRLDLELELAGTGNSPHAVAASLNGWTTVRIGEGHIDNSVLSLITADVLATLIDTLNPFGEHEPYMQLECGLAHVEFTDGIARLEPLAVQSRKMTLVGNGRVRLSSEELDLKWAAKPRKGVGLSASTVTNRFIKLGGTLSAPSLEIKPIEAITSTGVAVATLGLSVMARGLWERATAERKVCDQGLKQIEKIEAKRTN